jgi:predicted nucleic-acid-binding Zn-ribbon protein
MKLLQNCSNRRNYEYDEEDVNHMFEEISKVLKETKAIYTNELCKGSGKSEFAFNK